MPAPLWVAKHCPECWREPSHCRICDCHQPRKEAENVSTATVFARDCETIGVRKTAPDECANTPEGLTTQTVKES